MYFWFIDIGEITVPFDRDKRKQIFFEMNEFEVIGGNKAFEMIVKEV